MENKVSKYFSTAVKMDEAFLKLLSQKPFEYITVKEICKEAGVNRSTFYLHYEHLGDLLDETIDYINGKFDSYFKDAKIDVNKISSLPLKELCLITPEYLTPWLNFIKENSRLFQTFLSRHETLKMASSYKTVFNKIISPILTRFKVQKQDQEYMFLYYVEGIMGIVKKWIKEGCARPIEEIANLITNCIKQYED